MLFYLFNFFSCVCTCTRTTCVWKPDVNLWYCSPECCPLCFLRQGLSLTGLEMDNPVEQMISEPRGPSYIYLSSIGITMPSFKNTYYVLFILRGVCGYHGACLEVRGQLDRAGSPPSMCGSQNSSSGHWNFRQGHLRALPPPQPKTFHRNLQRVGNFFISTL